MVSLPGAQSYTSVATDHYGDMVLLTPVRPYPSPSFPCLFPSPVCPWNTKQKISVYRRQCTPAPSNKEDIPCVSFGEFGQPPEAHPRDMARPPTPSACHGRAPPHFPVPVSTVRRGCLSVLAKTGCQTSNKRESHRLLTGQVSRHLWTRDKVVYPQAVSRASFSRTEETPELRNDGTRRDR